MHGLRLAPPLCPLVLARCPPLLKQPEESLQVGGWAKEGCGQGLGAAWVPQLGAFPLLQP